MEEEEIRVEEAVRSPLSVLLIVTWGPGGWMGTAETPSALTHRGTQSFLSRSRPQFPHLFRLLKVPFVSHRPH